MDVRFVIVSPARKRGTLSVKLPILIGRAEEAKFRIQQDSVSRRHCEVFLKEGGVYVRDLGSTNGTFLDGEQVTAAVASFVRPAGEIRIGGVAFRVEYTPQAAVVPEDVAAAGDETASLGKASPGGVPAGSASLGRQPTVAAPQVADSAAAAPPDAEAAAMPGDEPAAAADDNLTDFLKSLK